MSERASPTRGPAGRTPSSPEGDETQRMRWFTPTTASESEEPWLEIGWVDEDVLRPGFEPATLIDVGAGWGTPVLYRSFPDAYHVMIEPLREYEEHLQQWFPRLLRGREGLRRFEGEHLPVVVGDREDTVTLNVDPEQLFCSSLLPYSESRAGGRFDERTIPMRTLDNLLAERGWKPPFGLKVDTEGYEHHVIAGATKLLEQTQFVIAEVSVGKRFEQSYTFAEFVALMDARGFRLYDILDGMKSRSAGAFWVDALFKPKRSG